MYQQLKYNLKKLNIVSLILCIIFLALPFLSIAGKVEAKQALWGDIGILFLLQAHRLRTIRKQLSPGVHLRFFTKLGKTGIYRETLAGFNDPRPKQKHGVLLIHGFSASTSEFKRLFPELDKACVLYYAVPLTGFGLEDASELRSVRAEQWLRDVEKGYLLLSAMAEEVSIVAHSMGSLLALYLTTRYPVKHLVLTSPYLQPKNGQRIFERLLAIPIVADVFMFLNPVLIKNTPTDLDMIARSGRFVYTAVPVESVKQLWRLSSFINFSDIRAKDYLTLIGEKDATIEIGRTVEKLRQINPDWRIEFFPESGHNILEDVSWQHATGMIEAFITRD